MADLTSQALRAAVAAALTTAGIASPGGGVVKNRRTPWPDDGLYPQVSVYTDGDDERPIGKASRSFDRTDRIVVEAAVQSGGSGTAADEALAAALDALADEIKQALFGSTTFPPSQVYTWGQVASRKAQDAEADKRRGLLSLAFEFTYRKTYTPTAPTTDLETVVVELDMASPGGAVDADGNPIPDGTIDAGVVVDGLEA